MNDKEGGMRHKWYMHRAKLKGIVARYDEHLWGDPFLDDSEWDIELSRKCQRCGKVEYVSHCKHAGKCEIEAEYESPYELLCVLADPDWLREHADELALFPPLMLTENVP